MRVSHEKTITYTLHEISPNEISVLVAALDRYTVDAAFNPHTAAARAMLDELKGARGDALR